MILKFDMIGIQMKADELERGYPVSGMRKIEDDFRRQREEWTSMFDSILTQILHHCDSKNPRQIVEMAAALTDEREALLLDRYPEDL